MVQDAYYLREYARAVSLTAARAPSEPDIAMFNRHSAGAVEVERSLHERFFAEFGLSQKDVTRTPMAPTNLAYTSYRLATAYSGSFPQLLGALLPCYWIYWEVGKSLLERGSPDRLYSRWIDTDGGEEFGEIVQAVLDLTDRIGPDLSSAERVHAAGRFATTSRYEWMFWEVGYRRDLAVHLNLIGSSWIRHWRDARPGDVIFANWKGSRFRDIDHVGIVTGMYRGEPLITQHTPSQRGITLHYWFKHEGPRVHVWIAMPQAG